MADVPGSEAGGVVEAAASSPHFTGTPGSVARFALFGDTTAPVVDNFTPPNGSEIEGTDPIYFDVTDDSGLFRRVFVVVRQNHGTDDEPEWIYELAHDGDNFVGPYANLSTRTNIDDGFQYMLRRDGGWLSATTVTVYAIDQQANEA